MSLVPLLLLAACSKVVDLAAEKTAAVEKTAVSEKIPAPPVTVTPVAAPTASATLDAAGTAWVTNPTSGARDAVFVQAPEGEGPFPTIVVVPGALMAARGALMPQDRRDWLTAGFALITFDADGRGESGGKEDTNGKIDQDGLAAILQAAGTLPKVDGDRIGVLSMSYGVTIAVGALSRYTTPARFLIDWEGPANRMHSAGCENGMTDHPSKAGVSWGSCNDDSWWQYREASSWVGGLKIPYQRVQCTPDHGGRGDFETSRVMVTAALAGGVPWVHMNDNAVTTPLTADSQIQAWPANTKNEVLIRYARELMLQTTGKDVEAAEAPANLMRGQGPRRPAGGGQRVQPGGGRPR